MDKKQIAETLKTLGVRTVKTYGLGYRELTINGYKQIKGIRSADEGPMTVFTSIINDNKMRISRQVSSALGMYAESVVDNGDGVSYRFRLSNSVVRELRFSWWAFRTYSNAFDYDPSYMTWWYCCEVTDRKERVFSQYEKDHG